MATVRLKKLLICGITAARMGGACKHTYETLLSLYFFNRLITTQSKSLYFLLTPDNKLSTPGFNQHTDVYPAAQHCEMKEMNTGGVGGVIEEFMCICKGPEQQPLK